MIDNKFKWKFLVAALLIILFIVLGIRYEIPSSILQTLIKGLEYIGDLGTMGVVFFIILQVVATVALIPSSIMMVGGGFVFGLGLGAIYVSIGSILGATASFLLGRSLFRNWVAGKMSHNPQFMAIDQAVAQEGWKIVLLTRLSPVFPFNIVNYIYGLTNIKTGVYALSSWVGMLPLILGYVYIGSLAGDAAALAAGTSLLAPTAYLDGLHPLIIPIMRFSGPAATILVILVVSRIARCALRKHVKVEL